MDTHDQTLDSVTPFGLHVFFIPVSGTPFGAVCVSATTYKQARALAVHAATRDPFHYNSHALELGK